MRMPTVGGEEKDGGFMAMLNDRSGALTNRTTESPAPGARPRGAGLGREEFTGNKARTAVVKDNQDMERPSGLRQLLESHRSALEAALLGHFREASEKTAAQLTQLESKLDELHRSLSRGENVRWPTALEEHIGTQDSWLTRKSTRSMAAPATPMPARVTRRVLLQEDADTQPRGPVASMNSFWNSTELEDRTDGVARLGSGKPGREHGGKAVTMDLENDTESRGAGSALASASASAVLGRRSLATASATNSTMLGRKTARKTAKGRASRRSCVERKTRNSGLDALRQTMANYPRKTRKTARQTSRPPSTGSASVVDDDLEALQAAQGHFKLARDMESIQHKFLCGGRVTSAPFLDTFSMILIFTSMIHMAVEADLSIKMIDAGGQDGLPGWLFGFDVLFTVLFIGELALRLYVQGKYFCSKRNRAWNIFDTFIVVVQTMDVIVRVSNLGFVRSLRVLRAIRAARIIRTVHHVRELRLMVASIFCSLGSLTWALVLLVLVLFLQAMCLMQTLQAHLENNPVELEHPGLLKYYGSLGSTMLSLFMAITGGINWIELIQPLQTISEWYIVAFVLYVTFVLLGMLNILTAVFVESTNKIAEVDAELVVQEQIERDNSALNQMRVFFEEADLDGSGSITADEFEAKLSDEKCSAQLQLLDLDVWTVRGLFRLLDMDECGVHIEELVYAMMRLRGSAKAVDVATLLYENKRIVNRLTLFMNFTEECFAEMQDTIFSIVTGDFHKPGSDSEDENEDEGEDSESDRELEVVKEVNNFDHEEDFEDMEEMVQEAEVKAEALRGSLTSLKSSL